MMIKSGKYNLWKYGKLMESINESSKPGGSSLEDLENDADVLDINQQLFSLFENHLNKYPIGVSRFGDNYKTLDLLIPPKPKKGDERFVEVAEFDLYVYSDDDYQKMSNWEPWMINQDCQRGGWQITKEKMLKHYTFHLQEELTKKGELKDCFYLKYLGWRPNKPNPKITCHFSVWSSVPGRSKYNPKKMYLEDLDKDLQKRIVDFVKEKLEKDAAFLNQYLK